MIEETVRLIEVKVTITRYDPSNDQKPYPQSFAINVRENQTVLDVLLDLAAEARSIHRLSEGVSQRDLRGLRGDDKWNPQAGVRNTSVQCSGEW